MNDTNTLLVEIGTEELPPKALIKLANAFGTQLSKRLSDKNLAYESYRIFAAPRRLAVSFEKIETQQADQTVERRGPAVQAAFDDNGEPTKAALGFARSCGVPIDQVGRLKTDKGEWLAFNAEVKGEALSAVLPALVADSLNALPIPKRMRWGAGSAEFVRPVHWLVMLLGDELVDGEVLGIKADKFTYGHRFHCPARLELTHAADYESALEEKGFVIADFEKRKKKTIELTESSASDNNGFAIINPELLEEVTALVEWPAPICGSYDEHFLELPREVLIASMQDHQKYFPLEDSNGKLINKFITIANIESSNPAAIKKGNERVIRPRLGDAKFFWDQDLKSSLGDKKERLATVVFEKRLGTLLEKTERVAALAKEFAPHFDVDSQSTVRAAELSRADLVSEMVGEFPELQGVMAAYYARHDGENLEVQQALGDFYKPRFAGDTIPGNSIAKCVSLADRLDTLVGIFAIGSAPTGDKDPYALRRAALGALRILIEGEVSLDLPKALRSAGTLLSEKINTDEVSDKVFEFMMDRLRSYYLDLEYSHQSIEAVLALQPTSPFDIQQRLSAVSAFSTLEAASDLAAANKRISNILRKASIVDMIEVDRNLMVEAAEKTLFDALGAIKTEAAELLANADYTQHLTVLAELKQPINTFFDEVMVMAEDPALKANRLALLSIIRGQFSQVADIGLLSE